MFLIFLVSIKIFDILQVSTENYVLHSSLLRIQQSLTQSLIRYYLGQYLFSKILFNYL